MRSRRSPRSRRLADWRAWLLAGAGGIAVAAGRLLGVPEAERLRPSGAASGAARVVRWNRALASRNRCLLPADLLAEAGVTLHEAIAAPESPAVLAVLRRVAAEGEGFLRQGPSGRMPRAYVAAAVSRRFWPGAICDPDLPFTLARAVSPIGWPSPGPG